MLVGSCSVWRPWGRVVQGLSLSFLPPRASVGSQITPVRCPLVVFALCVCTFPSVYTRFCVQISPLYNSAIHVGLGPTLMPLIWLALGKTLFGGGGWKATFWDTGGKDFDISFLGDTIQPLTMGLGFLPKKAHELFAVYPVTKRLSNNLSLFIRCIFWRHETLTNSTGYGSYRIFGKITESLVVCMHIWLKIWASMMAQQ